MVGRGLPIASTPLVEISPVSNAKPTARLHTASLANRAHRGSVNWTGEEAATLAITQQLWHDHDSRPQSLPSALPSALQWLQQCNKPKSSTQQSSAKLAPVALGVVHTDWLAAVLRMVLQARPRVWIMPDELREHRLLVNEPNAMQCRTDAWSPTALGGLITVQCEDGGSVGASASAIAQVHSIVSHRYFETFILVAIMLNILVSATEHFDQSEFWQSLQDTIDSVTMCAERNRLAWPQRLHWSFTALRALLHGAAPVLPSTTAAVSPLLRCAALCCDHHSCSGHSAQRLASAVAH